MNSIIVFKHKNPINSTINVKKTKKRVTIDNGKNFYYNFKVTYNNPKDFDFGEIMNLIECTAIPITVKEKRYGHKQS